jgi:hypothetical protein
MRMRVLLALGAAALWFAVPALAANFEYKGIRLGMPLSELHSLFPKLACDDETAQVTTCQEEHGDGDGQESYVFNLFDGKLARANIWVSTNKYREAKETFVRQLGKPTSKSDNEINKKKTEVLTWMRNSPAGLLVLEQATANDPTKANIMMNDDMLVSAMTKKAK